MLDLWFLHDFHYLGVAYMDLKLGKRDLGIIGMFVVLMPTRVR